MDYAPKKRNDSRKKSAGVWVKIKEKFSNFKQPTRRQREMVWGMDAVTSSSALKVRRRGSRRGINPRLIIGCLIGLVILSGIAIAGIFGREELRQLVWAKPQAKTNPAKLAAQNSTKHSANILASKESEPIPPKFEFYSTLPQMAVKRSAVSDNLAHAEEVNKFAAHGKPKYVENNLPINLKIVYHGAKYSLQVAAFNNLNEAENLQNYLKAQGLLAYLVNSGTGSKKWYRVRLGPYNCGQALQVKRHLALLKIKAIELQE